ncbi:MAG: immunoglobulin domain-containing protein [Candidatus Kapabacteria bacterium]|nr:immunoglobulin domain-containing protein [Candidatus Kapabacteria bacterium]
MKKQNLRYSLVFIIFSSLIIAFTLYLYADADGKTGRTSSTSEGCGNCHGSSSSNVNLSVSSQTGSFTVLPNSQTIFTVTLTHPSLSYAGINIGVKTSPTQTPGVNAGTLSTISGSGLKLAGNPQELTQSVPKPLNGGSVSFSFYWTAPSEPGTYYLRAVGLASDNNGRASGDEWNWMQVKEIIVAPAQSVTLTYPNGGEKLCMGSKMDITWNYSEISFVKIELSPNGGQWYPLELVDNYPAQTKKFTWTIPTTIEPGTDFVIRISDASNPTINDVSNSSFSILPSTRITKHPEKQSVCEGYSASFSCSAEGVNLRYQWYKGNNIIQGATLPVYSISNPKFSDTGFYKVKVTGDCGASIFSDSAKLEINLPPKIVKQPEPVKVCLGEKATFSVKAEGFNLSYRWLKNGIVIQGATGDTYTIESVKESDAGLYSAHISGACPPTQTSQEARLSIDLPPTITVQPQDQFVEEGADVTFTCDATGTLPDFQWQKNGENIANEIGKTLTIKNVKKSDEGNYTCVVKNNCGTRTTRPAKLTIKTTDNYALLTLSSSIIDFGSVNFGTSKDTLLKGIIKNTGNINLEITQAYISGTNASEFEIQGLSLPLTVKPNETSDLNIRFQPISDGSKSAIIHFVSNSQTNPTISLIGNSINSVDEYEISHLTIKPNPANGYIEISLPESFLQRQESSSKLSFLRMQESEIRIFNILGKCVLSEKIHPITLSYRMNIEHLPAGLYYARLGNWVGSFVKI